MLNEAVDQAAAAVKDRCGKEKEKVKEKVGKVAACITSVAEAMLPFELKLEKDTEIGDGVTATWEHNEWTLAFHFGSPAVACTIKAGDEEMLDIEWKESFSTTVAKHAENVLSSGRFFRGETERVHYPRRVYLDGRICTGSGYIAENNLNQKRVVVHVSDRPEDLKFASGLLELIDKATEKGEGSTPPEKLENFFAQIITESAGRNSLSAE